MKIVAIDDLDRDHVDDILICDNVENDSGHDMVDVLNRRSALPNYYFIMTLDDYKLKTWEG